MAATGNIKVKSQEEEAAPTPGGVIDPTWKEEVAVASLVKAWKGFVEKLREDDRLALTATMSIGDPELRGLGGTPSTIHCSVSKWTACATKC